MKWIQYQHASSVFPSFTRSTPGPSQPASGFHNIAVCGRFSSSHAAKNIFWWYRGIKRFEFPFVRSFVLRFPQFFTAPPIAIHTIWTTGHASKDSEPCGHMLAPLLPSLLLLLPRCDSTTTTTTTGSIDPPPRCTPNRNSGTHRLPIVGGGCAPELPGTQNTTTTGRCCCLATTAAEAEPRVPGRR